ncbi:MAG TPA: hypothetical protein VD766_02415, partial [Solirubrobacterales bacterium]|nr:hypothetical protein [Solirubrobacterales bacterium]
RDVADYLVERGYSVYLSEWHPIVRYGIRHQWRALLRYPARLASVEAWGNMLAFRDDPGTQALEDALNRELEVEEADGGEAAGTGQPETRQPIAEVLSPARPPSTIVAGNARSSKRRMTPQGSRYERFYLRIRDRSQAAFAVARMATWCARKARQYPLLTLAYLALVIGLVVGAFTLEFEPYGAALLGMASLAVVGGMLVVAVGFSRFLIKESHHDLSIKHLNLRRRVEKTEAVQRREPAARTKIETRIGTLDASLSALGTRLEGDVARVRHSQNDLQAKVERERSASLSTLREGLADLLDAQVAMRDSLVDELAALKPDQDLAGLKAEIERLGSAQESMHEALKSEIAELRSNAGSSPPDPSDHDFAGLEAEVERLRSAQESTQETLASELVVEIERLRSAQGAHDALAEEVSAVRTDLDSIASLRAAIETMRADHASTFEKLEAQIDSIRSKRNVGRALESAIAELSSAQEATQAALIAEIRTRERAGRAASEDVPAQFKTNGSAAGKPSRTNP